MGNTAQESAEDTEETESDLSGSSIWASESHGEHSAGSGEEDDIDSFTNEGTISPASSGFEIGSPVIVDLPYSSEEETERNSYERSLRPPKRSQNPVRRPSRRQSLADEKDSEESSESEESDGTTSSEVWSDLLERKLSGTASS